MERFDFETLADEDFFRKFLEWPSKPLSFSGAHMKFKNAPCVIKGLEECARRGSYPYTMCDQRYTDAVIRWMKLVRGWHVEPEWIVPTYGTTFSVNTALRAFTDKGDKLIVQRPIYFKYERAAKRNEREILNSPMIYKNGEYHIDYEDLERCMSDERAKLMVICNPHNPTARIWSREEQRRTAVLAEKYGVTVFSDEIFAETVYGGREMHAYVSLAEGAATGMSCTGIGKAFSFTGINNANMIIPDKRLREIFIRQRDADHYGSADPFAYAAVVSAYEGGESWVAAVKEVFEQNIAFVKEFFARHMPQVHVVEPQGSWVIWIDFSGLGLPHEELFDFMKNEGQLVLEPGTDFGPEGECFARMCIGSPTKEIERAFGFFLEAARKRGLAK